jgi:hypothetical protein
VDTNNTALKTTNVVLSVDTAKELASIGGVRLGMTMEEVVATRSKPIPALRWCQGGGPRLNYTGAKVIFDGTNNCVRMLLVGGIESARGEQGLTVQSKMEDWIRVLGRPARRSEVRAGYMASGKKITIMPQAEVAGGIDSSGQVVGRGRIRSPALNRMR